MFFWSFMERFGSQTFSFVITIFLARLLTPEEFGIVALVLVITSLLEVFLTNSLSVSLIQRKKVTEVTYSTVFYANICLATLLYSVIFITAPFIENYFNEENLGIYLLILASKLFIYSVSTIQKSIAIRNLNFKVISYTKIISVLLSGSLGISLAINGFKEQAIIYQIISQNILELILLSLSVRWHPRLHFSYVELKAMIGFSGTMLLSSLSSSIYSNISKIIVAKVYSAHDLAIFNQGKLFPQFLVSNTVQAVANVLFPIMSRDQDSNEALINNLNNAIIKTYFFVLPMIFGLIVIAEELVVIILTEKWIGASPILIISSLGFLVLPLNTFHSQVIKAKGQSKVYLKADVYKKIVGIVILFGLYDYGLEWVAIAESISAIIGVLITFRFASVILGYNPLLVLKEVGLSLICSIIMMLFTVTIKTSLTFGIEIKVISTVFSGIIVYCFVSYVLNKRTILLFLNKEF